MMKQWIKVGLFAASVFLFFAFGTAGRSARAFSAGPPFGHAGAPGESNCTACHSDFAANQGLGSVSLGGLPLHYTPGQSISLTVKTAHPDGFLYGFQLTVLDSNGATAGTLVRTDVINTQIVEGVVAGFNRSYIEHTADGTFPVEFDQRVWSFTWTAPATDIGPVTFYIAGNGADGNGETSGDYIYTANYTLACTGITPSSSSYAAAGGDGVFDIGSACSWMAVAVDDWISITSGASGTGAGNTAYTVAANPTTSRRVGTIVVGGASVPVFQGANFLDVPEINPFYTFIGKFSARGLTSGCGGGNYCPGAVVTREQMAVFIIRAMGIFDPPAPSQQTFADVPPAHPFFAFVEEMARRGITSGCGNDQLGNRLYCPGAVVSREQMAVFIIRALGEFDPPTPGMQRFMDVPPEHPFYAFIEEMAVRGITVGCGGGNYCPSGAVTRDQMATFLVRAFGL